MKNLMIGLVSLMATIAFANDPAPTTTTPEMPKDAAHGAAPATPEQKVDAKEHKAEHHAEKKAATKTEKKKKNKKKSAEKE